MSGVVLDVIVAVVVSFGFLVGFVVAVFFLCYGDHRDLRSFPARLSSALVVTFCFVVSFVVGVVIALSVAIGVVVDVVVGRVLACSLGTCVHVVRGVRIGIGV